MRQTQAGNRQVDLPSFNVSFGINTYNSGNILRHEISEALEAHASLIFNRIKGSREVVESAKKWLYARLEAGRSAVLEYLVLFMYDL